MNNRIYQVVIIEDYYNIINNDSDDFTHPFFEEISKVIDSEDSDKIGFDGDNIFINLPEPKVNNLMGIINIYFDVIKLDVSLAVINGEFENKYLEVEELTPGLFKNYREHNTTVNNILDKINLYGISSLDKMDIIILKKETLISKVSDY